MTGETTTNIKKLVQDPPTKETQWAGLGRESGNMTQGDAKTGAPGRNSIFGVTREDIAKIPKDQISACASIVVDFRPQKKDPNRAHTTAGGNLIQYPGELYTRTADLAVAKNVWNSAIHTEGARSTRIDIGIF